MGNIKLWVTSFCPVSASAEKPLPGKNGSWYHKEARRLRFLQERPAELGIVLILNIHLFI